jgi:hypothetical protein
MEWILVIVLVLLLLGSVGPRAGWYGTANVLWDIVGLILVVVLLFWLLRILGVLGGGAA